MKLVLLIGFLLRVARASTATDGDVSERVIVGLRRGHFYRVLVPHAEGSSSKRSQCLRDFSSLFNTTDPVTGLSLGALALDASGKVGSGIHKGNTYALGDYDGCLDVGEGVVQYCIVPVALVTQSVERTSVMHFRMGMCIPPSCSSDEDLEDILEGENKILAPLKHHLRTEASKAVCTAGRKLPYSASALAVLVMCWLFVGAAVVGSIIDLTLDLMGTKHTGLGLLSSSDFLLNIMTAFSLFKSIRAILTTKQPPSTITSLSGIRVISMFWIILYHVHLWFTALKPISNQAVLERDILPRLWYQIILNGYFSVDSFFLLSGTVAAYNNFRAMEKRKTDFCHFPIFNYYVHRYLRLTLVYAFVVSFRHLIVHLTDGPLSIQLSTGPDSQTYSNCDQYWWTNLLYINNLYPWRMRDECMCWSWSLANDMQFYVLSPIILIPLYYSRRMGLAITAILLSISFIATATIVGIKDFSPVSALRSLESEGKEQTDNIYIKPYCRIAPYLVGLMLGYILHYRVQLAFHGAKKYLCYASMWSLATFIFSACIFGLYGTWYGHRMRMIENITFYTFTHFAWGVGVAIVVFACNNGYGWVISDFLSMNFWIPLSRLTYSVTLVHPIVLEVVLGSVRQVPMFEDINLVIYTISVVVLSYGAAGVLAALVEFPLANVETLAFKLLGIHREESVRLVNVWTKVEETEKKDD